ncbi:MAG: sugar phosphate isomerase/epimerase [Lachnospiraceae bacterium]|nr:sugar phosphate isomerase/epimerase [Lachnospiraceae bacterium]
MIIATTGSLQAGPNAPIVYRGSYEEIFPMMAEDGYRGVELHIRDSREIDRKRLGEQLKQNLLTLTSIGTGAAYGAWHWNLGDHDKEIRRKAMACLKEHMITASPHHALIIIGSMQGRFRDAVSEEEFINNIEESLYHLDRLAEQYDVSIGYEIMNHYESDFLFSIKDGVRFMEEHSFKRIGLHIDTVHMNIDESDLGNGIRMAGPWIRHVHIADNDRYYPGHGHMNFREIIQGLKDIDYDGALALETFCKPTSRICGKKSLEYLKFILEEVYGKDQI